MYELIVEREFCAAHAIVIAGEREPVHGHNWRVTLVVAGPRLDADGLLCDFHLVQAALDGVLKPWQNRDLNAVAPFDRLNPTAELVAHHIAATMAALLPEGVMVRSVRVSEAPGCAAVYRPALLTSGEDVP